jgi:flavin-dependent dehydrogenase
MNDHVKALSIDSRKLRLYCLRISDQILILGNGGAKSTRTYQENEKLTGYVLSLQNFDKALAEAQKNGSVTIEKNLITNIESVTFKV